MKKIFFIALLVIATSAFTKASSLTKGNSAALSGAVTNQSYTVSQLLSNYSNVEFKSAKSTSVKVQSLPHGDVTDGDGNVIGYWVYDGNSGVLLIVLY